MNIEIITFWYNEAFLAPFFLKHYSPLGRIKIFVDVDTDDDTLAEIRKYPGASVRFHRFRDGMNTQEKQNVINRAYDESDADWVIVVDADEFIDTVGLVERLSATAAHVVFVKLMQVYRHSADADLDPTLPVLRQRRHGDPNITEGINALYRKPIVARTGLPLSWAPGCHVYKCAPGALTRVSSSDILGSHWAMADPCFCIDRKLSRSARRSEYNRNHGMSWHWEGLNREKLLQECKEHSLDPEVL